jgi:hypothetical protein
MERDPIQRTMHPSCAQPQCSGMFDALGVWSIASAVAMMDQSIERESAFDPDSKRQRCVRRLKPFGRSLHDVVITAIGGRNIP